MSSVVPINRDVNRGGVVIANLFLGQRLVNDDARHHDRREDPDNGRHGAELDERETPANSSSELQHGNVPPSRGKLRASRREGRRSAASRKCTLPIGGADKVGGAVH
jgi:hypothetical protein